ncbi:MAG: hypothetical protein M3R48_09760 [Candidatus Dormibacteraeota bacterium]|nr:hypothetical protein [Candidatus Dormibacteraeota bacterium]
MLAGGAAQLRTIDIAYSLVDNLYVLYTTRCEAPHQRHQRMHVARTPLYLVVELVCRLSTSWRRINAPNQLDLMLAGHPLVDGKRHRDQPITRRTSPRRSPVLAWKCFHTS